jgi:hypothetical protein
MTVRPTEVGCYGIMIFSAGKKLLLCVLALKQLKRLLLLLGVMQIDFFNASEDLVALTVTRRRLLCIPCNPA